MKEAMNPITATAMLIRLPPVPLSSCSAESGLLAPGSPSRPTRPFNPLTAGSPTFCCAALPLSPRKPSAAPDNRMNDSAASGGVSNITHMPIATSGGESNPSWRRRKPTINSSKQVTLSWLLVPPRLNRLPPCVVWIAVPTAAGAAVPSAPREPCAKPMIFIRFFPLNDLLSQVAITGAQHGTPDPIR